MAITRSASSDGLKRLQRADATVPEVGRIPIRDVAAIGIRRPGTLRRAFWRVLARESAAPATPHAEAHIASKYSFAMTKMPQEGPVLDVGTGTAFGIIHSGAPERFFGVDKNRHALKLAGLAHPELEGRLLRADARNLEFKDLAGITAFELVEHLGRRGKELFLYGASRSLRPGGVLVLSTPLSFGPIKTLNMFHFGKELDLPQLRELLGRYFGTVEYYGIGLMPRTTIRKLALRANEFVGSLDVLHLRRVFVTKSLRSRFLEETLGQNRIQTMEKYQEQVQLPRNVIAVAIKSPALPSNGTELK